MKKVFAFLLIIASLCSCEPKNVRDGREAYDYMLSICIMNTRLRMNI